MREVLRKLAVGLLSIAIALVSTDVFTVVLASTPNTEYELYPRVHEIEYNGTQFTLKDQINIVAEEEIDSYTRAKIEQVLQLKGYSKEKENVTYSTNIVEGKTNVLLGVYGSEGVVDEIFKNAKKHDADHFTKTDSHILWIDENQIAILGKDTDATFYGITTLKEIFNQLPDLNLETLTITDYADVAGRGFIEGYYGEPWSVEDRIDLMTYGGDYKLNNYIYAPKDDPYHNSNWRSLYDDDKLNDIAKMAEAGNRSKCYYVYALHTFMHNAVRFDTEENYQEDLQIIKKKFKQVMNVGVRQFAILADDAYVPAQGPETYIRLCDDITKWLEEESKTVSGLKTNLIFCPNDYMGNGSSDQMQTLKSLPENVSIVQTGGTVWGSVNPNYVNTFYKNMDRPAYMWINWPCSDNSKNRLIMGGNERFLQPGIDPSKINGIVLNPMQQAEANKSALFANADYSWHIWENKEQAQQNWEDSFKYMDHGTAAETKSSTALRELSRHMKNSNTNIPESEELLPKLNEFSKLFEADQDYTTNADELIQEFTKLKAYASYYKEHPGNERTLNEIIYWMDCWEDTMDAGINFLEASKAYKNGAAVSEIWDLYSAGQAAFEKSKTHGFNYVDHTEYAVIGNGGITPFIKKLESDLGLKVNSMINPNIQLTSFITNRTDTPSISGKSVLETLTDGSLSSEAVWKTPNSTAIGDYIGIRYTKPEHITNITFHMGTGSNPKDTFQAAKIQYTTDGSNWIDIEGGAASGIPKEITAQDLNLDVLGVRLIATENRTNMWLGCQEIEINKKETIDNTQPYSVKINSDKVAPRGGSLDTLIDGDKDSNIALAEDPYKGRPEGKDFIPEDATITLTFNEGKKELGTVYFKQADSGDMLNIAALEYTEDGQTWKTLETFENKGVMSVNVSDQHIFATAVRIRNLEQTKKWWTAYEFEVLPPSEKEIDYSNLLIPTSWNKYAGNVENLYDGNDDTDVEYNPGNKDTTKAGDYIGYDFGRDVAINYVHAAIGGKRAPGNKWNSYVLEVSNTGKDDDWKVLKTYNGVSSGKDIIDEDFTDQGITARYIRFRNLEDKNVWIIFSEFTVQEAIKESEDLSSDYIYTNIKMSNKASHSDEEDSLKNVKQITLNKNEYIGFKFERIKDLASIVCNTNTVSKSIIEGLALQVSNNAVYWNNVNDLNKPGIGRYVRLINVSEEPVKFNLEEFTVKSNELHGPSLYKTTMGINSSWGVAEDTRENNAAFDGDVTTTTEFGDLPQKGQYIIYDLGLLRDLSNIKLYNQDSAVNYIRDAEIYVSEDCENWGEPVMIIGDGIENLDDANVNAGNALKEDGSPVYKASSTYPNKVYAETIDFNKKARYLKIEFTASNNNRAVLFNEIELNNGEYVRTVNDPTFVTDPIEVQGYAPQNLIDGDLSSSYKPNTNGGKITSGSLLYRLSEYTNTKKINIIQSGSTISNAKVIARGYKHGETKISEGTLGTLNKTLNELINYDFDQIFEIEIKWNNIAPTLQEIIVLQDYIIKVQDKLEAAYQDFKPILKNEDVYTSTTFKDFKAMMEDADKVIKMPDPSQELIDTTLEKLKSAHDALTKRALDVASFKELYDTVVKYESKTYAPSTWDAFDKARNEAASIYNALLNEEVLADTTQKAVDEAYDNLKSKTEALVALSAITDKQKAMDDIKKNYASDDYTKASYSILMSIVDDYGKVLADTKNITNKAMSDMDEKLQTAVKGLLDIRPLKEAFQAAEKNYGESAYAPEAWQKYQELLNKAKTILEKEDATAEELEQAVKNCEEAKACLNADALQALTNTYDRLKDIKNEEDGKPIYAKDSYDAIQKVLSEIQTYLKESEHHDEKSLDLCKALEDAEKGLVDIRSFKTFLEEAANLTDRDYTKTSWKDFIEVLTRANEAYEDPALTNEKMNEYQNNVSKAKDALIDIRPLQAAIKETEEIKDLDSYTQKSAETFKTALENAKACLAKDDASNDDVKTAVANLQKAQSELIEKADYVKLNEMLEKYKNLLDLKDSYTEKTFETFKTAYDALAALKDDGDLSKTDAEQAMAALEKAVSELVKYITINNKQLDVIVNGTSDVFSEKAILNVLEIKEGATYETYLRVLPLTLKHAYIVNLDLEVDGASIQPNGKIKVKIAIPKNLDRNTIALYSVNEKETKEMIFSIEKDYIVFDTTKLGAFALFDTREDTPLTPEQPTNPVVPNQPTSPDQSKKPVVTPNNPGNTATNGAETSDTTNFGMYFILLCAGGLLTILAAKKQRTK